eukprot:gb/GECH01001326.1/.p1 GENE.gb/GECH01001326.1/~~gb/GECH01001326.1/.p1  ORF type:complete len:938 (+),score=213.67 gb/GECH01001326.1/:1-2814(+)
MSSKEERIQKALEALDPLPESYTGNSNKEDAVLRYVEEFRHQYTQVFPHQNKLLLVPDNEARVPKFICTFIRPTEFPYHLLYHLTPCARFVAAHIVPVPVDTSTAFPDTLLSPAATLRLQQGDPFDMAVLLASLLIGNGYDAHCVTGYAHRNLATNNTAVRPCPHLPVTPIVPFLAQDEPPPPSPSPSPPRNTAVHNTYSGDHQYHQQDDTNTSSPKYPMPSRPHPPEEAVPYTPPSHHPQQPPPPSSSSKEGNAVNDEVAEGSQDEDSEGSWWVHSWVLVRKGTRSMEEDVFVDAGTGETLRRDRWHAWGFRKVCSVFNDRNYHVNMQQEGATVPIGNTSFDLDNLEAWEKIFLPEIHGSRQSTPNTQRGGGEEGSEGNAGGDRRTGSSRESSSAGDRRGKESRPASTSRGNKDSESGNPEGDNHGGEEEEEEESDPGSSLEVVSNGGFRHRQPFMDLPHSWSVPLRLPFNQYEDCYPELQRTYRYADCTVELHAEYSHPDGVVRRFQVNNGTSTEEHVFYSHRSDLLQRRSVFQVPGTESEPETIQKREEWVYGRGRRHDGAVEALRHQVDWRNGEGILLRREYGFYPETRRDGLKAWLALHGSGSRREDSEPIKVKELYCGREDHLERRSVRYRELSGMRTGDEVLRMSEHFSRDLSRDAEDDVAKRVYYMAEGTYMVCFHYAPSALRRSSHEFSKEEGGRYRSIVNIADPFRRQPKVSELEEEFRKLSAAEPRCLAEMRAREERMRELGERLKTERQTGAVRLLTTVYDTRRNKPAEREEEQRQRQQEEEERARKEQDFLYPYLAMVSNGKPIEELQITPQLARKIREVALQDLRQRMATREQLIEERLEKDRALLSRLDLKFQKQEQVDPEEEERHNEEMAEVMFRMNITQKRKERHQQLKTSKEMELRAKLDADPRLARYSDSKPSTATAY